MLKSNLWEILQCLETDTYKPARDISKQLNISVKTVRTRIKELEEVLKTHGAGIESKPRFGYILSIKNNEKYSNLLASKEQSAGDNSIPDTVEDRVSFLLAYLLNQDKYIKLDDLCEFIYISKSTLTSALKLVEGVLEQYGIKIDRRPNYGILAVGREMDFRRCIGELFIKRDSLNGISGQHKGEELKRLAQIVRTYLQKYKISFSETAYENFVNYIYVARKRILHRKEIELTRADIQHLSESEWNFVEELVSGLEQEYKISYPEAEVAYIALHLAGKRMVGNQEGDDANFVIRSEMDQLVMQMLEIVYQEFHIDLRHAFDLRMSMNQHMVPFDIRIRYDITLENPMLNDIKNNYIMAYRVAEVASTILTNHYKKEITEDEIGYFALLFALALEKQDTKIRKQDILIVCSSGKGSSRLLKYRYQQEFRDYLNHIYICDLIELECFDFTKIEYVFTTVPILMHIPVPILEVGLFLEEKDIQKVKKVLSAGKIDFLRQYYKKEAFLTDIRGNNKEEVLRQICAHIVKDKEVSKEYYAMVLEREKLGSTDFGNLVAIPHPFKAVTDDTFVYVAVLDQPITWNRYEVQVVFMTNVGRKEDPNLQRFYELTTRFIVNKDIIQELIETCEYENLISLFQKLNQ